MRNDLGDKRHFYRQSLTPNGHAQLALATFAAALLLLVF